VSDLAPLLALDPASLKAVQDQVVRAYLTAGKAAVSNTTKWLERELEELTRQAVPGKLWRAWASEVYPRGSAIARQPVGEVFVNGGRRTQGAMTFWSSSGRIKTDDGEWLAIPTPAAGPRNRNRELTIRDWELNNPGIRLNFVYRGGRRSALLVAEGTTSGRNGVFRPITRARTAADARRGYQRGVQSVVIFVLVPSVAFGNAFAIEPSIGRAERKLQQEFVAGTGRRT
jgi:hypothetical protein